MRYFLSMIVVIAAMNISGLYAQESKAIRPAGLGVAPVIESLDVSSHEYRPGNIVTVNGVLLGEQADKALTVYFYRPGGLMSFYMDLNVISWTGKRIVAHVPGMDSANFRLASDHYETSTTLPEDIKNYMNRYWMQGNIEVAKRPDQGLSNAMSMRIGPAIAEAPVIRFVPEGQAEIGGSFWIYGEGFDTGSGSVFLKGGNRITELENIEEWGSTMIKVKMPSTVGVGKYEIYVRDAAGHESNKKDIDAVVELETGIRVEGTVGAEQQRFEHKKEPLEGAIPGQRTIFKEPPLEGTVTPSE